MAAEGGASWITIHARTRAQGYAPPVHWKSIGQVRAALNLPVIANGDIWTLEGFRRCREETGCIHFMLGRSALADPLVPYQIARELGVGNPPDDVDVEWATLLRGLIHYSERFGYTVPRLTLQRLKQWLSIAAKFGDFRHFELLKRTQSMDELFTSLGAI